MLPSSPHVLQWDDAGLKHVHKTARGRSYLLTGSPFLSLPLSNGFRLKRGYVTLLLPCRRFHRALIAGEVFQSQQDQMADGQSTERGQAGTNVG